MKKLTALIILCLVAGLCFSNPLDFKNEKYEKLLKQESYEKIIETITKADESSYSAGDCYYLGLACFKLERDDEAQKYLKMAIQMEPDFSAAYYYLAGSYYYSGRYDEAIPCLKKCIEMDENDSDACRILGGIYEDMEDYESALFYYSRFHEIENCPESTYLVAFVLYEMKDYENARPYVEQYLDYDPNSFSMNNIMVLILYGNGEYELASKYELQLQNIWESTQDEDIKKMNFFFVYSFEHNGYDVNVYEKIVQKGPFYSPFTCNVKSNGKVVKTVNLEYDALLDESFYVIGINDLKTNTHYTTDSFFREKPEFPVFIDYVKRAIDGELENVASSTRK